MGLIDDPRLVAAIVDRLTFIAHIVETGSDSYRLRLTRERQLGGGAKTRDIPGGVEPREQRCETARPRGVRGGLRTLRPCAMS